MKSIFSFTFIFLLFISCATHKTPYGYYRNIPKEYSGLFELVLFQEGTYSYKFNGHMSFVESTGSWIKDSLGEIYLTSEKQYKNDFVVSEDQELDDKITIKVLDRKTQDILPYANVVLYSKAKKRGVATNLEGISEFDYLDIIDSIDVSFIGYHNAMYIIKNQKSNRFTVELSETNMSYLFLKDKKLILKCNKLLWPNESGSFLILKKW
ncbi:MAG: hypothetical protein ACI9Y7_002992 [Dokdonia sp.]|jgi:hypothetical protein